MNIAISNTKPTRTEKIVTGVFDAYDKAKDHAARHKKSYTVAGLASGATLGVMKLVDEFF